MGREMGERDLYPCRYGTFGGRITRNGTNVYNPANPSLVVPVTILHHNRLRRQTPIKVHLLERYTVATLIKIRVSNPHLRLPTDGDADITSRRLSVIWC